MCSYNEGWPKIFGGLQQNSKSPLTIHTPDQVHKYLWLVKLVWHLRQKIFPASQAVKNALLQIQYLSLVMQKNGIAQKV